MTVETVSPDGTTVIRVGNAGIGRVLPSLVTNCSAQPPIRSTQRPNCAAS